MFNVPSQSSYIISGRWVMETQAMKVTPHVVFNCCTEPILGAEPQLIIWRREPIEAFLLIFAINLTSFGAEDPVEDTKTFIPGAQRSLLVLRWVMLWLWWVELNLEKPYNSFFSSFFFKIRFYTDRHVYTYLHVCWVWSIIACRNSLYWDNWQINVKLFCCWLIMLFIHCSLLIFCISLCSWAT